MRLSVLDTSPIVAGSSARQALHSTEACPAPELVVSVSAIVAETDDRAEWLAGPIRFKVARRKHGERVLLPSPHDVDCAEPIPGLVVGSPDTVRKHLQAIADETGADELMITTPVHDHADRRHSYQLLIA